MESAHEYFFRMHQSLANNYRTPDDNFSESCFSIACEIAKRFLLEGQEPTIYWVGRMHAESESKRPMLKPLRYGGKVEWACHVFTGVEGIIWDPLLPKPTALRDYPLLAFDNKCSEVHITIPNSKIRKVLQR
jgi:hypothetical protein